MTREEHINLASNYRKKSIEALSLFGTTLDNACWEDYEKNKKLANKHYGIANSMFTRKYGRI